MFFLTQGGNGTQGNFQAADLKAVSKGFIAYVTSVCGVVQLEAAVASSRGDAHAQVRKGAKPQPTGQ